MSKRESWKSRLITRLDKLSPPERHTEMHSSKPDNPTLMLSDLMVIPKIQLSQSLSKINSLKASLNASLLNKTWLESLKVWPVEEKYPSVRLSPLSSPEQPIKSELQVSAPTLWNVSVHIQVAVLERTDHPKWLWKIWLSSELYPRASFWFQVTEFQLRKQLNWQATTTMDHHSSEQQDLTLQFFTRTTSHSNWENVILWINAVKIVKKSEHDSVCIVTCGVLVHESLKAAEKLGK